MTINVLVSGLPGNMAGLVAQRILSEEGMKLADYGLTGIDVPEWNHAGKSVALIKLEDGVEDILKDLKDRYVSEQFVLVDYTAPTAVNSNTELYCRLEIPFVMGTTGGDRQKLLETAKNAGVPAVIDVNMSPAIVVFKAMLAYAAKILSLNYPNNPTGAVADESFYKEVIDFARKYKVMIVQDAAYASLRHDGKKNTFLQVEGASQVGFEVYSASKAFNATGWRFGFAAGNPLAIEVLEQLKIIWILASF
ncbi:MAG: aminotransferase class I/II-fold pyridoxal phosphate-dependent enzyme [Candidatus Woesearchaeota archaeon]